MNDWERIVKRCGPAVWRTAWRLLGRHSDAADCYQEAFASALEIARRERVRNWKALLRQLATRRALDILRRRYRASEHRDEAADVETLAGDGGNPVKAAEAGELAERLRGGIARLPERQAEAFCLRFVERMSYRGIARRLGVDTNAVGVLLHRARKRLGELLEVSDEGR